MDKNVEKHKAMLQAQNAVAIERLRSEFRQQSLEHEVKYRRTDEKIAERLDEVYRRLLHFYKCIVSYVKLIEDSSEPSKEVKLEETAKANKEFWDCFILGRLYIPPTLFKTTKAFAHKLTSITNDFTSDLQDRKGGREVDGVHLSREINEEQASVLSSLVEEFQRRLGVFDLDEE